MDKPVILFLHGALGTSQDLAPLRELVEAKGFKTLGFDFSGHGTVSAWPNEFRIDLFAHDLENYLKKHNLKDVVVFGHSMGGYVALYHKCNFEDSPLKSVITYGTKFNWTKESVARELPMLNPEHIQDKFPQFAEALAKKHGERWKQLLRSTAHMMQNLEKLDGLTREDLNDVDIPVVLVLGDQDRMVTSEETHLASTWLHGAQLRTVSHSKHELDRSNLKEISEIIEEAQ